MNRRKFINLIGCGCLSFGLHSCSSAPITDRKQLKLIPEAKLNAQAAAIYEKLIGIVATTIFKNRINSFL